MIYDTVEISARKFPKVSQIGDTVFFLDNEIEIGFFKKVLDVIKNMIDGVPINGIIFWRDEREKGKTRAKISTKMKTKKAGKCDLEKTGGGAMKVWFLSYETIP